MRLSHLLAFLSRWITAGLAIAFIVLMVFPELMRTSPVVQVNQGPAPRLERARTDGEGGAPASYAGAVAQAAPAVVNVHTAKVVTQRASPFSQDPLFRRFFGDAPAKPRRRLETSLGSGVVVSPQGYILTNNHVIAGADEIRVMFKDGRGDRAEVVGTDPETDLAVLRIDLDAPPAIRLSDGNGLAVGDVVLAIGNPFGVGQTVTMGIVSATGRSHLGINTFEDFIQTDAAINPGNSGGALVNAYGQLIGINTAIFSRSGGNQGIGFAIPVALAQSVMRQIIERGYVARGWLGIEVQELSPSLAESFRLESTEGVLVAGVLRGGPADDAGLVPGDVITHVDDAPVADPQEAVNVIAGVLPGEAVRLRVVRDGESLVIEAEVAQRPVRESG